MREIKVFMQRIGIAAVFLTLGACASKQNNSEVLTAEPASVSTTAQADEPSAPPTAAAVSSEALVSEPKAAPKEKKGVLATIDKMEENPLTLYWRESNSYTYTIGSQLKAEYKPGESFVLQDSLEGQALKCQYNANGILDTSGMSAATAEQAKKACGELMFSFDILLSE